MKLRKKMSQLIALVLVFSMLFGMTANAAYVETENGFLYNETSAREVTVTVSVSSDGYPILGNNRKETPMELVEVTVPYFDLALYGLERYYRYPTGDTGYWDPNTTEVVRRPTVLHLYIYLLEKYYLGLDERQCCKAYDKAGLFEAIQGGDINNIWGEKAYSANNQAYVPSGGAASVYMTSFWGHGPNLIYYLNGEYPLWRRGSGNEDALIGATHDYILLEDGDRIDIGMFSNENFCWNMKGGFLYFPQDSYTIREDDTFTVDKITRKYGFMGTGFATKTFFDDLSTYNYIVKTPDGTAIEVNDANYEDGITFEGFEDAGTYYIYAFDKAAGQNTEDSAAICTPGIAKVVVKEAVPANVKDVLDKLGAIGEVTYSDDCKAKIDAARTAYDALSDVEKKLIFDDELNVLSGAEKIFSELKLEADKKAEEEAKKKAEEEAKKKAEEEAKKKAEEEAKKMAEEEAKKKAEIAKTKKIKNSKISSFKAKKYKKKGVKLTWKKNKNLTGYKIYQSTKKNKGFKLIKSTKKTSVSIAKGLKKGKTYYFKIQGYGKVGKKTINSETKVIKYKAR